MGHLSLIILMGMLLWAAIELIEHLCTFYRYRSQVVKLLPNEDVDYNGIGNALTNGLSGEPLCHARHVSGETTHCDVNVDVEPIVHWISHLFHR